MRHIDRKARLEGLLLAFQSLWRPQPFKIETPDWCAVYPALTAALLGLDDEAVARLEGDNEGLIAWLSRFVPELAELARLIAFPPSPARGGAGGEEEKRLYTDIPGRKQAQIVAYAEALGQPRAPLLEWCSGKGHLGRLLAHRWHWPVASLEIDPALCEAGEDLARHAHADCMQHFIRADALTTGAARHLNGRHAIALHACGDLHTRLIAGAIEQASPALDVAPCCYYRTANERYRPFIASELELNHDDLRLAVTETVTASARQRQRSRRALAWKLGWVELRKALAGEPGYRTFPPVPEAWLRGTFEEFVRRMCERVSLDFPARLPSPPAPSLLAGEGCAAARERADFPSLTDYEALGHARAARMLRLQLVRLAFRRPLETWLLMDMAVFLENQGYAVTVRPFCDARLTPRNLLLSARRYTHDETH